MRNPWKSHCFSNRSVPAVSGERGERVAAGVGDDQLAEVGEQRAALLAAGGGGRQGTFGESLTVVALGAERHFAVDDRRAERALGRVVCRLDPVDGGECPERGSDLEQVVGELAVPAIARLLRRGLLE